VNITWRRMQGDRGGRYDIEGSTVSHDTESALKFLQSRRGLSFREAGEVLTQAKYACATCGTTKQNHTTVTTHDWKAK
jgi:hypothetical protein